MRDYGKGGALTEVTFYILLALYTPRHGYAVMQFIEEKTGGRLVLGAGTLYGALNTLADKGWIAPWGKEDSATCEDNAHRGKEGSATCGDNAHRGKEGSATCEDNAHRGKEDASPSDSTHRKNQGASSWGSRDTAPWKSRDGRKKEYMITPLGREIAAREYGRLQELTDVAAHIMDIRQT